MHAHIYVFSPTCTHTGKHRALRLALTVRLSLEVLVVPLMRTVGDHPQILWEIYYKRACSRTLLSAQVSIDFSTALLFSHLVMSDSL